MVGIAALVLCPLVTCQAAMEPPQKKIPRGSPVAPAEWKQKRLNTALIEAIKRNDTRQVQLLLRAGADANAQDKPKHIDAYKLPSGKVLLPARWYAGESALECALSIGTQLNHPNEQGGLFVFHENLTIIKALLDRGANVNARDDSGTTPLMSAVSIGHMRTIKLLLDRGADPRPRDKDTPSIETGHGVTSVLTNYGRTAMHYAIDDDNGNTIRIFQFLLKHGADINARDGYGRTPLNTMAAYGQIEPVRFLLKHGAQVNVKDQTGTTPLMYAANSHYVDILKALLASGAEVNARDKDGKTALTYSMEPEPSAKVAQLLKQAGGTK